MAKYTKPNYSEQWASAGNIVAPNSVKIQTGHIVEKPNYEYMNWIQNRQDTGIAYAAQLLVASGVTLNGTLAFSANAKIKTLIYRGSNVWSVLGGG